MKWSKVFSRLSKIIETNQGICITRHHPHDFKFSLLLFPTSNLIHFLYVYCCAIMNYGLRWPTDKLFCRNVSRRRDRVIPVPFSLQLSPSSSLLTTFTLQYHGNLLQSKMSLRKRYVMFEGGSMILFLAALGHWPSN